MPRAVHPLFLAALALALVACADTRRSGRTGGPVDGEGEGEGGEGEGQGEGQGGEGEGEGGEGEGEGEGSRVCEPGRTELCYCAGGRPGTLGLGFTAVHAELVGIAW